ncbi:MAG TPA: hypothetical protein VI112_16545, partial [Bacteroidia bacterium]
MKKLNIRSRIIQALLLLLCLPFYALAVVPTRKDSVHFSKTQLSSLPARDSLLLRDSTMLTGSCDNNYKVRKATFNAYLY